jgi:hypothetical protein
MSGSLPTPLKRALALAILVAVPLLIWIVAVQPLIGMVVDHQHQIVDLSERLARLKAAIARIPELKRDESAAKQRLEAAGGVWTGTSEAALAAAMQDRLREAVSKSDGVVKSTSHLRGADEQGLQTVRIRFSVEGTLDTVQRTLAVIETSKPVMFVDSMTIVAPATFPVDKPPLLGLDMEVIGYMSKAQP